MKHCQFQYSQPHGFGDLMEYGALSHQQFQHMTSLSDAAEHVEQYRGAWTNPELDDSNLALCWIILPH